MRFSHIFLVTFALVGCRVEATEINASKIETDALTPQRKAQLLKIYKSALTAIEGGNYYELDAILGTYKAEIQEALDRDIVKKSLLYTAIYERSSRDQIILELLASHKVETGTSKAYRRHLSRWILPGESNFGLPTWFLQDIVGMKLLNPEDLWINAIHISTELFDWLMQVADIDYRIPLGDNGEFETVLARCLMWDSFELVQMLLQAGVNLNVPPKNGYSNFWHLALAHNRISTYPFLPQIASLTQDLFTPFYDERFAGDHNNVRYPNQLCEWIFEEVDKRVKEGSIDLAAFDKVDERGWTLLDRVSLFIPREFRELVQILRNAGLPTNYPLTGTFYLLGIRGLHELIETGQYNCNEQAYPDKNILTILIEDDVRIREECIKFVIKMGASVIFPPNFEYKSAIAYTLHCRKDMVCSSLIKMMAERMSLEQLIEVRPYVAKVKRFNNSYLSEINQVIETKELRLRLGFSEI